MKKLIFWLFLFLILSCLDLTLTSHFLHYETMEESNPIARIFHESWGVPGLALLKTGSFVILTTVCSLLAYKNMMVLAQRLAIFGTIIVLFIVIYSSYGMMGIYIDQLRWNEESVTESYLEPSQLLTIS